MGEVSASEQSRSNGQAVAVEAEQFRFGYGSLRMPRREKLEKKHTDMYLKCANPKCGHAYKYHGPDCFAAIGDYGFCKCKAFVEPVK